MDVVWLKKDVRLHDHAPLCEAARSGRPFVVLFLYEPEILQHHTVHGSHVHFQNEGLADLDARLALGAEDLEWRKDVAAHEQPTLRSVSVLRGEATRCLEALAASHGVTRLLAHEETGHLESYARDRRVRRWCAERGVEFVEFCQNGVTRRLSRRDDFTKLYDAWVSAPERPLPPPEAFRDRLVRVARLPEGGGGGVSACERLLTPEELGVTHGEDRAERQRGGESRALDVLVSFLKRRGVSYSASISSPASAWDSCSRLSPYLSFGQLGLRHLSTALATRQAQLRRDRSADDPRWLKSLASSAASESRPRVATRTDVGHPHR